DPMAFAQTKSIAATNIQDLSQKDTTKEEKELLKGLALLVNTGKLGLAIDQLIEQLRKEDNEMSKQLKALPQDQLNYTKGMLQASVEATLRVRGLTTDSKDNEYLEWSALSNKMIERVNADENNLNILGLSNSLWVSTRNVQILVDGPASFSKRESIMGKAVDSINILTWSIYDDMTGAQSVDLLLARKKQNPNLKIRVIVDGQVAATLGHGDQVKRLEENGVEVIRWFSTAKPFAGQHRKMIIVDNKEMIAGGLNMGDVYSHKNPDTSVPRWRDTDIYVEGSGAAEGNRLFAQIWNEQVTSRKLSYAQLKATAVRSTPDEKVQISVINHDAVKSTQGSTVMLTILKAIRTAQKQIDIENAYIILFPALKNELKKAITERGVKVRVFTNSGESVDEPIVSIPILRSVSEFADMGAEVYVKRGATLHSKLVIVDGKFSIIMSYNLHPRSERIEGEMAILVKDAIFAENLHNVFTNDITPDKAYRIRSSSEVQMPSSPVSVPTLRLFFDML
ncbi:MAG: phosphatidylserine/phosphatidylglycerophosphate/cardiolipin synthase family protein, partial [Bdellovibrionaceae bacterium]|nr:phosphatidylserine/phosphatidylglycerophosphate/cardiolipin synthase family protein [Pseudobdellovibrionaceae bacterium]